MIAIFILLILVTSPGDTVGRTYLDWQGNGSLGRFVQISPLGGYHFIWQGQGGSYNYFYPPNYWLGPTQVNSLSVAGLAQLSDGRAVVSGHHSIGGNYRPAIAIDAAEGAGSFTIYDLPFPQNPSDPPIWLSVCVDSFDNIYVSGTQSATGRGWVYIGGQWFDTLGGIALDSMVWSPDRESWTTYNGKIAVINSSDFDLSYYYWESTDNGSTWRFDTVFNSLSPGDSVIGYIWQSGVYDNNNNLHVVFTCIDTVGHGSGGSGWRSLIRHWNQGTGQIDLVASGWYEVTPGPGRNHPTVSEPQIAINRTTGELYCTWCQADSDDVAQNGYTNLEIYGAYSNDNGITWIEQHDITNSHSPGAPPGQCDNDCWQSIAETTHGDTIYLFYMNDKDAGSSLQGEGNVTMNPMLFYAYYFSGAIEETLNSQFAIQNPQLQVYPNPFRNTTGIKFQIEGVASNQKSVVSIQIYNALGRLVRRWNYENTKQGDQIIWLGDDNSGNSVPAGVYIIKYENETNKQAVYKKVIKID